MPLNPPRQGQPLGFRCYPAVSGETTLGTPEAQVWSSIRQLTSLGVAEHHAGRHGNPQIRDRRAAARNVRLYIQQSSEFYAVAYGAKANTAPLLYYYSFLNLAKALCELKRPNLHARPDCYRHGISWRPNPRAVVNLETESVTITTRGVWHLLWEALMGGHCPAPNPARLRVRELFALCPEISIEFSRSFRQAQRLLDLVDPEILHDAGQATVWTRFSVHRADLKLQRLPAPRLQAFIQNGRGGYSEVRAPEPHLRTFETAQPANIGQSAFDTIHADIAQFNLFTSLDEGKIVYVVPVTARFPLRLPQVIVLYSILYWLGSLVRYDPHSLAFLMDSPRWILLDGFMSQSRVWLLELMEWAIYQTETTLNSAR